MATSSLLVTVATITAIWALFALGLNIKFGYTGLLDFGHVAFWLIGAYTTALLLAPPSETQGFSDYILGLDLAGRLVDLTGLQLAGGVGWVVALLAGTVVAGLFGLLVALPAIRLRADYLAIALLGISVIVKRTVQTETWLANGPDSLRGYPRPLRGLFPVPGETAEGIVMFAIVLFVLWSIAVALLAREAFVSEGFGTDDTRSKFLNGLFAVLTLGVGYVAARRARDTRNGEVTVRAGPALAAGLVIALVGAALAAAGFTLVAMLLTLGTLSVFSWAYAGVWTADHFDHVPRRDWVVALGLAVGLLVPLLPSVLTSEGVVGTGGLAPTAVLFVLYFAGVGYLFRNWSRFGAGTSWLSLLGIAGAFLFVYRYFLLSSVTELGQGDYGDAVTVLVEDVLFLVGYQGDVVSEGLTFGYDRFLFAFCVGILALGYLMAEVTVRSPYGRVLKAIREDEDVAMALGKNTFSYKVQSMMLGSALAGMSGGLVAIYYGTLTFRNFDPLFTFFMFLIVVIGGRANNAGVILGAVLYWAFVRGTIDIVDALPTEGASIFALRVALLGAIFIVILYYRPQGIWGEQALVEGRSEE